MQDYQSPVKDSNLTRAFSLIQQKKYAEAEGLLLAGLEAAEKKPDDIMAGLYYSAFGVLYKVRKEFKKAWKFYEKAEKLIPYDPSLKLITSRLLVEYFGQYDTVIRKMQKLIATIGKDHQVLHQAYGIMGRAYLAQGKKKEALDCLKKSMTEDFSRLQSVLALDLDLVEALIRKNVERDLCKAYLKKALGLAKKTGEAPFRKIIEKMIALFPADEAP